MTFFLRLWNNVLTREREWKNKQLRYFHTRQPGPVVKKVEWNKNSTKILNEKVKSMESKTGKKITFRVLQF